MRIAIIAKSGPAAGRRIVLRGGQIARVGRTDWADFALPEDLDLADIHFAVHCNENSVAIHSLAQGRDTKINRESVNQVELHHGDVIEAGATLFHVEIEGAPKLAIENIDSAPISNDAPNRNETFEIAEYIGLSEGAIELAKNATDPKQFGNVLIQSANLKDALSWYAHTIPKPQAVHWACGCVEEVMQNERRSVQLAAYRSALRWSREPNDDNREDAKQLAEIAKHEGVGGILAASAGWSGGSLGPSNVPPIPPDDRLTARCLCIALSIAGSPLAPEATTNRLMGYLNRLRKAHTTQPLP
jgi:Inner membrane component of T3SS, cytoplasmic domain